MYFYCEIIHNTFTSYECCSKGSKSYKERWAEAEHFCYGSTLLKLLEKTILICVLISVQVTLIRRWEVCNKIWVRLRIYLTNLLHIIVRFSLFALILPRFQCFHEDNYQCIYISIWKTYFLTMFVFVVRVLLSLSVSMLPSPYWKVANKYF